MTEGRGGWRRGYVLKATRVRTDLRLRSGDGPRAAIEPFARRGAGVRRIWAVNDGEKVERDARDHPASLRNSAWDGHVVRLSGARNESSRFR